MLLDIGGGRMGIHVDDKYKQIGEVYEAVFMHDGKWSSRWHWHWDEEEWGKETGTTNTRRTAVAAILSAGGYRAIEDNATIPDLLEGL